MPETTCRAKVSLGVPAHYRLPPGHGQCGGWNGSLRKEIVLSNSPCSYHVLVRLGRAREEICHRLCLPRLQTSVSHYA